MSSLRAVARRLWRDRGFSLTAAVTLAVCLGANAALLAVVGYVLLRPLPVPESDRLVFVYNTYPNAGVTRAGATAPDFVERQADVPALAAHALFNFIDPALDTGGTPERVRVMRVTPSFFPLIRVPPQLGRAFGPETAEVGRDRELILTDGLWQQAFGGEDVLGRSVRLNGDAYTIVGVMPPGFTLIDTEVQAWIPIALTPQQLEARVSNNWGYLARLAPGATIEQAQAQIDALNAASMERFPQFRQILEDAGFGSIAVPLDADLVRDVRPTLYLLWAGALFVLLIGVVNVASLTLVRARSRLREMAVRLAIGARPWHLVRQLAAEHVLLALVAGAGGLVLGNAALAFFRSASEDLPRGADITLDATVATLTLAASAAIGLLIALVPALAGLRVDVVRALREEGRSGTAGRGTRAVHRALVVLQMAAAFVLLVGAGLLLASFRQVLAIEPGFDAARVLTSSVSLNGPRYEGGVELRRFADDALREIRAVPGVEAAGATSIVPLSGVGSQNVIFPEGYQITQGESLLAPYQVIVTPGYFEAMQVPLVAGRFFDARDAVDAPRVVVVDRELGGRFWPGADPLGRRMFMPNDINDPTATDEDTEFFTVIGVTGDVRIGSLVEQEGDVGAFYMVHAQSPRRDLTFTVRTAGDPLAAAGAVRAAIARVDPALPIFGEPTMRSRLDDALSTRRLAAQLSTGFGLVALLLAALGLYGVLAYQVTQRSREIGVRLALGGSRPAILRLILREGLALAAAGLVLGTLGAALSARVLAAQLYGVGPGDPSIAAGATLLLAAVALAACGLPARRATRVDPVVALAE